MGPIVNVKEGKLLGKVCKTENEIQYFTFKGVPYAKPPVGELRFAAPKDPDPWVGIRNATRNCNICAQFDRGEILQIVGDEDCLYLNIYTPSLPHADTPLLPVMVYIHGGGFIYGNGTDDSIHGPDYLVERNVVIVSMNYRLGILGFLSLDCKEAPGNMGLKDQVMALKWVQQNIRHFNGDSSNVTIFGVSAGAVSVEYLLISPMSKGLFHKAIAQSGTTLVPWAQNNKIRELAAQIPVLKKKVITDNQDLLRFLKDMPIKELLSISKLLLTTQKWKGGIHFGFVPAIEKPGDWEPFFSKSTYDILVQGDFHKVPFMTGFCTREGLLMLAYPHVYEKVAKHKKFIDFLPFQLDETQKIDFETRIKTIYLKPENKYKDDDAFAIDFFTDLDFAGGIYVASSLIAKNNSPVYLYEFNYDGNCNYTKKKFKFDREGACHGDEKGYLFRSEILNGDISVTDKLVRDRMCKMWTNFAKYGNPTPKIGIIMTTKWEPVAENKMSYLLINDELTMKADMSTERTKLYKELYKKFRFI